MIPLVVIVRLSELLGPDKGKNQVGHHQTGNDQEQDILRRHQETFSKPKMAATNSRKSRTLMTI
jgi:hypothetical protein